MPGAPIPSVPQDGRPGEGRAVEAMPSTVGSSPDVDDVGRWVLRAVASVLAAEQRGSPAAYVGEPPPGAVDAVIRHRVTTLLADHAGALGLDDEAAGQLAAAQLSDVAAGLAVVVGVRTASAALAAAGVDHLMVKGVALSATVGRAAATRGPGDIDLWVRPAQLGTATEALAAVGWLRGSETLGLPSVGSGWRWRLVERIGNELPLIHPRYASVDLHWRLTTDPGELGFGFGEAWAASVPLDEVGEGVRGLCPSHALSHVVQHARKEHFCLLRQCVDVIDLARTCTRDEVVVLAEQDPNVALGLAVVAPVAPWLGASPPEAGRVARLAAEVQSGLGSLRWTHQAARATRGAARVLSRWRRESWLIRSAPRPGVAARHLARSLVPLRLLADEAPLRHRRRPR